MIRGVTLATYTLVAPRGMTSKNSPYLCVCLRLAEVQLKTLKGDALILLAGITQFCRGKPGGRERRRLDRRGFNKPYKGGVF